MKKLIAIITCAALVALLAGCAGQMKNVERHRNLAESAFYSSNFIGAKTHVDSAATACPNPQCQRDAYRWLLSVAIASGNDVLRADAYERIILSHMDSMTKTDNSERDSAFIVSRKYIAWADTLHSLRGDPFPLADALVLGAEIALPDSPGIAVEYLIRVAARPEGTEIPSPLIPYINRAERKLDEIGEEMALRYNEGLKQLQNPESESALPDLKFAYGAATGFRNAELATETAKLIAEYYRDADNNEMAGIWAGNTLLWESKKKPESTTGDNPESN